MAHTFPIVPTIAVSFLCAMACDGRPPTELAPAASQQIASNAPAGVAIRQARVDTVGSLVGHVVMQTALGGKALVMAVDTSPADGLVDRIFVLQSELTLPVGSTQFADARVDYRKRELLISAPREGLTYVIGLVGRGANADQSDARVVRLTGFGLTKRAGGPRLDSGWLTAGDLGLVVTSSCDVASATFGPFSLTKCTAGGPGSTDCSIHCTDFSPPADDCSVSCAGNYYSCCNCLVSGASCLCKRIGSSPTTTTLNLPYHDMLPVPSVPGWLTAQRKQIAPLPIVTS